MRALVLLGVMLLGACQSADTAAVDPANATYRLDQRTMTLSNGLFEESAAPGSAAKATTRLHEKRATRDLNGDSKLDAAVVLTAGGSGSGTFHYLAGLLGTGAGRSASTNGVLLGDRIGVDAVRIDGGKIVVETLERRSGEPFTTAPSVKVTRTFQVKDGSLSEVK